MNDLNRLKQTFDQIGIHYKESMEEGYTYISVCSEGHTDMPVNTAGDNYFEFDEHGDIASY